MARRRGRTTALLRLNVVLGSAIARAQAYASWAVVTRQNREKSSLGDSPAVYRDDDKAAQWNRKRSRNPVHIADPAHEVRHDRTADDRHDEVRRALFGVLAEAF